MNTIEIFKFLNADENTKYTFLGVYPLDMLPKITTCPASIVINLDCSTEPGSHWVALYFNHSGNCEYFDSYGRKPLELESYINRNASCYIYNNIQVQDFSTTSCGHMCIYFLVFRARGFTFKHIIKSMLRRKVYKYFLKSSKI